MTSCKDQKFQSMIIVRSDEMALLAGEFSRLPGSVIRNSNVLFTIGKFW